MNRYFKTCFFISFLGSAAPLSTVADSNTQVSGNASLFTGMQTEAAATVIAFNTALESGDARTARRQLDDDVLIFEGGGVERSADEYAQHHMQADMGYLQAVNVETLEHHIEQGELLAVSFARRVTTSIFKGEEIRSVGSETVTLRLHDGKWKITHIHWSTAR